MELADVIVWYSQLFSMKGLVYYSTYAPATIVVARAKTVSGHLGNVLCGSSRFRPLYKITGSDPDSALDHV